VIKFVSDLRQVGGFPRLLWFPPTKKTDRHDIAEILLKVTLTTTTKFQDLLLFFSIIKGKFISLVTLVYINIFCKVDYRFKIYYTNSP
jgi:hypothetical protein